MEYRLSEINACSKLIVGAAIEVHRELGPGLLESVYEQCLAAELRFRGLEVERQVRMPVAYKGEMLGEVLVLDMIVNGSIILELKATEVILPVHGAQLLSYLRLTGKPMGLLLNFCVPVMMKGIARRINDRAIILRDEA